MFGEGHNKQCLSIIFWIYVAKVDKIQKIA